MLQVKNSSTMESNRSSKRRGFTKSKLLMSFYRAAKPSSAGLQPYSGKPKSNSSFSTSLEFVANQQTKPKAPPSVSGPSVGFIIVKQDQGFAPQKPKVAFVVPDDNSYGKLENFYGGAVEDDEAVDAKAARYISTVRERFLLERVNSERKN